MFVDLMADIYTTFAERFLRAQISFGPPGGGPGGGAPVGGPARPAAPKKRYNALGVLEDVPADEEDAVADGEPAGVPAAAPAPAQREPMVVGAGRPRPLNRPASVGSGAAGAGEGAAAGGGTGGGSGAVDWSTVGRNDPCPCGSGKKFKKCHGATA